MNPPPLEPPWKAAPRPCSGHDLRQEVYADLHGGQLVREEEGNRQAARLLLTALGEYVAPGSLLDVGCGLGSWMKVALESGFTEVRGLEAPWLDPASLMVDPALVETCDFERPFALGRRFDLVVCVEVAEHLSPAAAAGFVDSLVAHGDLVLFSAAVPGQTGHHHVNEQFLDYWVAHFARHGYALRDLFRGRFWSDPSIHWWLRQNLVLFASEVARARHPALRTEASPAMPLSVVHPVLFLDYVRFHEEMNLLMQLIQPGGTFRAVRQADGSLTLDRLPEGGPGVVG